jgi:hypothetical protein
MKGNTHHEIIEEALLNPKEISFYVDVFKRRYKNIPNKEGLYAFWFNNHDQIMKTFNLSFAIPGPGKKEIPLTFNWNTTDSMICLYIGKTNDLKKRLSQHLLLGTKERLIKDAPLRYRKTTACQLRSGFDLLYINKKDIDIIKELNARIYLDFIEIENFITRFYTEDYFIGKYRPWFNLDSER